MGGPSVRRSAGALCCLWLVPVATLVGGALWLLDPEAQGLRTEHPPGIAPRGAGSSTTRPSVPGPSFLAERRVDAGEDPGPPVPPAGDLPEKVSRLLHPARAAADLESLRTAIELALQADPIDPPEVFACLGSLASLRSEPADAALVELLDRDVRCPGWSRVLAELLAPRDDARIYPAALRGLARLEARGRRALFEARGYLRLMATKGGARGARNVLDLLRSGEAPLSVFAAELVPLLQDHATVADLCEVAADSPQIAQILRGLLQWRSPSAIESLVQYAVTSVHGERLRRVASRTLAEHATPEHVVALIARYPLVRDSTSKCHFLDTLKLLRRNDHLGPHQRYDAEWPILQVALRDADPVVRRTALTQITTADAFRPEDIQYALSAAGIAAAP